MIKICISNHIQLAPDIYSSAASPKDHADETHIDIIRVEEGCRQEEQSIANIFNVKSNDGQESVIAAFNPADITLRPSSGVITEAQY